MAGEVEPSVFRRTHDQVEDPDAIKAIISTLGLQRHPEGGFFVETDRDARMVPNPFADRAANDSERSACTTIHYFLTPSTDHGAFHRNKGKTVHTHHRGRGRYVIIHADELSSDGGPARVETFVVGPDLEKGERLQWIVEGGKFKASFLLPDAGSVRSSEGLLISEVIHACSSLLVDTELR